MDEASSLGTPVGHHHLSDLVELGSRFSGSHDTGARLRAGLSKRRHGGSHLGNGNLLHLGGMLALHASGLLDLVKFTLESINLTLDLGGRQILVIVLTLSNASMLVGVNDIFIELGIEIVSGMIAGDRQVIGSVNQSSGTLILVMSHFIAIGRVESGIAHLVGLHLRLEGSQLKLSGLGGNGLVLFNSPGVTHGLGGILLVLEGASDIGISTKARDGIIDRVIDLTISSTAVDLRAVSSGADRITLDERVLLGQSPRAMLGLSIFHVLLAVLDILVHTQVRNLVTMGEWRVRFSSVGVDSVSLATLSRVAVGVATLRHGNLSDATLSRNILPVRKSLMLLGLTLLDRPLLSGNSILVSVAIRASGEVRMSLRLRIVIVLRVGPLSLLLLLLSVLLLVMLRFLDHRQAQVRVPFVESEGDGLGALSAQKERES